MKLYPILFEAAIPPPLPIKPYKDIPKKGMTSYTAPEFALFVHNEQRLILVHSDSLLSYFKNPTEDVPIYKICAGMIECTERKNDCLGIMQVSYAVGSPEWKGAGITLYGLAGDYFDSPLTSDRDHSSSVASKETWAKIEQSSEWKKAGEGFDNFAQTPKGKIFVDIEGNYPKRLAEPRVKKKSFSITSFKDITPDKTIPKTSTEIDDCPLPTKGGSVLDPEKMANLVGTADAYRYKGPLKAAPLVDQATKLIHITKDSKENPKNFNTLYLVYKMSEILFKIRYKGSETSR